MAAAPVKVLIIDDSRFVRRLMKAMLDRRSDFLVVGTAGGGIQGLELAETLLPDVITLDLDMPDLSGMDTLKRLRRSHQIPVVIVSGLPIQDQDRIAVLAELGVTQSVVKSFSETSYDVSVFEQNLVDSLRAAASASVS
jgi:two-component system chemotaxis response regulator CheB